MSDLHVDPATGRRFYVDPSTGVSRWADQVAVPSSGAVVPQQAAHQPQQVRRGVFTFDGGVLGYLGINLLAFVISVCTLGLLIPLAVVLLQRWRADHTMIDGHRLRFTGSAMGLFGHWLKWWLLCVVTLGIYSLWVGPRLMKWTIEHQEVVGL